MPSSGLRTGSRSKAKGGDKEQRTGLCGWRGTAGPCARLVLFHVSLMISRTEGAACSLALQTVLSSEELRIPK